MKINPDNEVKFASPDAEDFAKQYTAALRGGYRKNGPSKGDLIASAKFDADYTVVREGKVGFMGAGTLVYTCKETGVAYKVSKGANGKGFYGTTHYVYIIR